MSYVEYVLDELLDDAGVRLVETRKLPDFLNACFHKSSRAIYVSTVIDSATRVSAIAHELGKSTLSHVPSAKQTNERSPTIAQCSHD